MTPTLILVLVIGGCLLVLAVIYNRLVALRQNRKNAFADIDVQLKQRADLIPNLVETVKGYATHEKGLLESVTAARASAMQAKSLPERAAAESALGGAMMNLLAVAERYPDLKANQNFLSLQAELSDIENKIAAARRFFNSATDEYNTAIQQFPAVLLAAPLGFSAEEYFGLSEPEKLAVSQPPKVSFQ